MTKLSRPCVRLPSLAFIVIAVTVAVSGSSNNLSSAPNVLVLLADDLGIADIGCYGNKTLPTPNIDRLCQEGLKFTHHLAAESVCSPSRAAFLTGRYPVRMGLSQAPGSPPVVLYVSARNGLPPEEVTWAKLLQTYGYRTAAVGKWHLGWNADSYGDQVHGPLGHGFDSFFGLPFTLVDGFELEMSFWTYSGWMTKKDGDNHPFHGHGTALILSFLTVLAVYGKNFGHIFFILLIIGFIAAWFFLEHFRLHTDRWWMRSFFMEKYLNSILMRNSTDVVEQPIRLPPLAQKLTNASLSFIRDHVTKFGHEKRPFALYHAFTNVHTPLYPSKKFRKTSQHGSYGDSVLEMDDAVGQILNLLDELKLTQNTIVYFTSDHGGHVELGRLGGSNSPYRGGKGMGAIEGGIRVPGIIRWPEVISQPGSTIDTPTSLLDFWPTLHNIIKVNDAAAKIPPLKEIDGKSFLPLLKKSSSSDFKGHKFLRHYCGIDLHALRYIEKGAVYKAYFKEPQLNDAGHCGHGGLCSCFGEKVTIFQKPKVFDMINDPSETKPLSESSEIYSKLLPIFLSEHDSILSESSQLPPSQYSSWTNVMPRPWMQPCAGFPICRTH